MIMLNSKCVLPLPLPMSKITASEDEARFKVTTTTSMNEMKAWNNLELLAGNGPSGQLSPVVTIPIPAGRKPIADRADSER